MQGVLEQGTKLTKMGADMGLMTKAMGMANAGNDKARQADTANALVPAKKKARAKLGKLYSWGSGDYGRLGHGDNLNQKLPKAVDVLRDKDVRKFACGARHCIALGSDGTVYSWGYGGDGLGAGAQHNLQDAAATAAESLTEKLAVAAARAAHVEARRVAA